MTDLTVIERAKKALTIQHTEAELKKLAKQSSDLKEIKNTADYELVKSSRITLKGVRVSIQKAGKSARDDANKFSKAVIAEEKRLIGLISPEEDRLSSLQKEVDDRAAREAEEKRLAEEARIQTIIDSIEHLRAAGMQGNGSAKEIKERLDTLIGLSITEDTYQEYIEQATAVHAQAVDSLTAMYEERKEFEEQQAKQARIAKEQAEKQAALDRQEAERKAEEEKRLAAIREREEAIARKEAELEAERKAEEDRKLAEERAAAAKVAEEKARLEQEKREREEAERQAAAEEAERARQEALRPEKDRLIDWIKQLRFIDGIELHDECLQDIQGEILGELSRLSNVYVDLVENA